MKKRKKKNKDAGDEVASNMSHGSWNMSRKPTVLETSLWGLNGTRKTRQSTLLSRAGENLLIPVPAGSRKNGNDAST